MIKAEFRVLSAGDDTGYLPCSLHNGRADRRPPCSVAGTSCRETPVDPVEDCRPPDCLCGQQYTQTGFPEPGGGYVRGLREGREVNEVRGEENKTTHNNYLGRRAGRKTEGNRHGEREGRGSRMGITLRASRPPIRAGMCGTAWLPHGLAWGTVWRGFPGSIRSWVIGGTARLFSGYGGRTSNGMAEEIER